MAIIMDFTKINPVSQKHMEQAKARLNILAKPPGSLGGLEDMAARLCAVQHTHRPKTDKRCVLVFAADNGLVEEGVASAPQRVTAVQSINMLRGLTGVGTLARAYGAELFVTDVGINAKLSHEGLIDRKIRYSTGNICKEAAMSREEAQKALEIGWEIARDAAQKGHMLIGIGEMGIGNTSTSTAVLAALMGIDEVGDFVGRGGGLSDSGFVRKRQLIEEALRLHKPDRTDVIDILHKVGGLDIAAMTGAFLGGAAAGCAMVIDGLISAVAALCAVRLCQQVSGYLFASHRSFEKGYDLAMRELKLEPCLSLNMRLGEGSGCPLLFSLMDGAAFMFNNMATFEEAEMGENYLEILGDIRF